MSKTEISIRNETFATLREMGYKDELITIALDNSKTKSIDETLELILTKESHFNKLLKKQSSSRKESTNELVENGCVLIPFGGQTIKNPALTKNKSENRKNSKKDSPEEAIDEPTLAAISSIIKSLSNLPISKDPNWMLHEVSEHLKDIKFNNSGTTKNINKFLNSNAYYSQISDLRHKVFEVLQKLMNMKVKSKFVIDIKELEYVILMSFELKLLKVNHMENIMNLYARFCNKLGFKQDEILMNSLDKIFLDASTGSNTNSAYSTSIAEDMKLLEDPVLNSCPHVTVVKQNNVEENKDPEKNNSETGLGIKLRHGPVDKEYCIVCMEKIRDTVFLPCCHFLTCPICSVKIGKCPLCNKKIEKTLKIFWS